jgi:RimJ/RimL family protein N-acetyltransferase
VRDGLFPSDRPRRDDWSSLPLSALPWPDPPLRSDRVLLRPWSGEDLPVLVALGQDLTVARWFPVIPYPYTERDALDWLQSEETARQAGKGITFAIVQTDSREVLGGISLGNIDALLRTASIGYWLGAHARGQGYMTPVVRLVAAWAFEKLCLARLEGTVDPENVASQRVAERCGFRREGRLRSSTIIRHTGERRDALVYGLLPDDLSSAHGEGDARGETISPSAASASGR